MGEFRERISFAKKIYSAMEMDDISDTLQTQSQNNSHLIESRDKLMLYTEVLQSIRGKISDIITDINTYIYKSCDHNFVIGLAEYERTQYVCDKCNLSRRY